MKMWTQNIRRSFERSLSNKLLLLVMPLTFILLFMSLVMLSTYISDFVNDLYESELMKQAETLELSLGHGFMTNDIEHVRDMVQMMGHEGQLISLRLLSMDGLIVASSVPDEEGVVPSRESEACGLCHVTDSGETRSIVQTHSADGTPDVVMIGNPIENHIACQKCHTASNTTLGILLIENPATSVSFWLERLNWRLVGGGIGLFMLVVAAGTFAVRRLVVVPLRNLSSGISLV